MKAQNNLKKYRALRLRYLAAQKVPHTEKDIRATQASMHAMDIVIDDLLFRARTENLIHAPLASVKDAYWERLRRAREIARVNADALMLCKTKDKWSFAGIIREFRP